MFSLLGKDTVKETHVRCVYHGYIPWYFFDNVVFSSVIWVTWLLKHLKEGYNSEREWIWRSKGTIGKKEIFGKLQNGGGDWKLKKKISSGDKKWKSLEKICFCCRLLLFTYDRSWISLLSFTCRNVKMGLTIFGSVKTTMARTFHKAESLRYPATDPQLEFNEMEKG